MAKPVILAVDDDRAVVNAIERDLRKRYGREYRVFKAESGASALDTLKQLDERGEPVALLISDQRMPGMTGIEFLEQARHLMPDVRSVLLTAYADTEAAISAINRVGLDYYLLKPWDPPEDKLYPVLDEQLDDWKAHARLPFDGIRVAGTLWSPGAHQVKEFLTRHQIPFRWIDLETAAQARSMVQNINDGKLRIPTVLFPDGSFLAEPTLEALAEKAGIATHATFPFYDVIVIGAGPAGLAGTVYSSSEGLKTLLIERAAPGGQAGSSPKIENYLGFPAGISGGDLTRRAVTQARRFGAEILSAQQATAIQVKDSYRIVLLGDGTRVTCHALLLATGASFHTLMMPGAAELTGKGIYYGAAHTEAYFYQGQDVFVVGGANSAAQGALFLSRFARHVTMLVRGQLTSSQYLVDALSQNPKIEILLNTDLVQVRGQEKLEEIMIRNNLTGEAKTFHGAAMFVFIGVRPQNDLVKDLVLCDEKGYVLTGSDLYQDGKRPDRWTLLRDPFLLETSVPGIFAAGDVRYGTNHRVASAAGEGAIAEMMIKQYLKTI